MRIAHVTATYPPYRGGAGTVAENLAQGLAARGHDVEVITAAFGGQQAGSDGIVTRLRPRLAIGNAPLLPGLARRVRDHDVVHLHYPFMFGTEALLAGRSGRRSRPPLVVSYHNRLIGQGGRRPIFGAYEAVVGPALARHADRVCVVSRRHAATVPYLRDLARRHSERVVELPNGVDLDAFAPGADVAGVRAQLGIPADALVATFVATLDRAHFFKRADLAIEALARAQEPHVHLLVVGDGEWLTRHREQAAAAGVAERVHFAGAAGHDRLPGLLRAGDFHLLCSDLESFGIVLVEAMACGLPVVASDLPGVRSVVSDDVGELAAPGDAEGFAEAIDRMALAAGHRRRALGAAARERCERLYGWDALVERLEAVYGELV